VNCRDGRLQGVSTETARSKSTLGERDAFGDLISIPQGAILPIQQDQISFRGGSSGAARFLQQHDPNRPITSGSGRRSRSSLPRRIASRLNPAPVASAE
jgi:hypothetical protein